nr:mannose-6-phosphate isomerase, class I [Nakamurella antarctica]
MRNRIRPYAWGSRTAIAELLGEPVPSAHPYAELWLGAHPGDPSQIDIDGAPTRLDTAIARDPELHLGAEAAHRFHDRLPFLLKVLAAEQPLSLQAHPSIIQAEQGYDQEDAQGIPLASPDRNYKDRFHKPELICALTPFEALCGFRDPAATVKVLAGLQVPELDHFLSLLSGQPDSDGVRALFSTLVTLPQTRMTQLLSAVLAGAVTAIGRGTPFEAEYRTALSLGERYPEDWGALASLMLNRLTLQPGEALYLPAGNLHAYLSGVGVEIMANSDNVLRGGLTPKHVDVPELVRILDFSAGDREVLTGEVRDGIEVYYQTPAPEFELSRLDLAGADVGAMITLASLGPQILLCTEGAVSVAHNDGSVLDLRRGQSAWIKARDRSVSVWGNGTIYRATVGRPGELTA